MASNLKVTRLGGNNANFQSMIQRFGVVTVMNARIYDPLAVEVFEKKTASEIIAQYCNGLDENGNLDFADPIARIDTLKVANANQEGPSKTITGGQYANPLVKYGKTMTLEMQDALGNAAALDALCGTVSEAQADVNVAVDYEKVYALHVTGDFGQPCLIIGDTFFIDANSGQQVKALIAFYRFLPDSIFNLTQDAEGDATVFDMNGSLMATDILVSKLDGNKEPHGVFYSIVDPEEVKAVLEGDDSSDSSGD